ncbi:MAG: two-component sensor histidine kinase [Acidobacteria bacterium]|nr:MAG: two-component sensor histidine kinase [Acidobacteriota bacterium]
MQVSNGIQSKWDRIRGLPGWIFDVAIVVIGGGIAVPSAFGTDLSSGVAKGHDLVFYTLLALIVLPFLVRRRFPLSVFLVTSMALVLYSFLGYTEGALPMMVLVGMYTVGSRCPPGQMAAALVILASGMVVLYLDPTDPLDFGNVVSNLAFFAAALMFGWTLRSRRERLEALEARAEALEREQEEEALRAVEGERLRIAQELHDVMAHSMGVIAVQAGAGMHVIDRDPAEAKRALENISFTSRSTLTELRRLLRVLRDETAGAEFAPAPGISDIGRLIREMNDAGVEVELHVAEDLDVPGGVDLTAYRIVQEALTNVLKHAGPAKATVSVTGGNGALEIEVSDDGRGVNGRSDGSGHGLIGMRERVAIYGGTLIAEPTDGGGFCVKARIPWGEDRGGGRA